MTAEYIGEYAEGCLEGKSAKEMEVHMASCPACAAEMVSYTKLIDAASSLTVEDPGAEFWKSYLPKLRKKLLIQTPWYAFLRKPLTASISLALLLLILLAPFGAGRMRRLARVRNAGLVTEESAVRKASSNPEWFAAAIEEYQLLSDASNVAEVLSSEEKDRLVAEMTADLMD